MMKTTKNFMKIERMGGKSIIEEQLKRSIEIKSVPMILVKNIMEVKAHSIYTLRSSMEAEIRQIERKWRKSKNESNEIVEKL